MLRMGRVLLIFALVACAQAQGVTVVSGPPSVSVVIVNTSPNEPVAAPPREPLPASYFIAFKGGNIRLAEQYWVDGATLYYITPDRERKTAPLESVDRALSEQLNSEQDVAFRLPPEERKTVASSQVVRHVAIVARRRKTCVCK